MPAAEPSPTAAEVAILMLSDNNFMDFFTQPIASAFLAISAAAMTWHAVQGYLAKRRSP